MVLTFGKHKHRDIEDVPSSYLRWITENFDEGAVMDAAEQELEYRNVWDAHFEED